VLLLLTTVWLLVVRVVDIQVVLVVAAQEVFAQVLD
jgi:hypothetical protein